MLEDAERLIGKKSSQILQCSSPEDESATIQGADHIGLLQPIGE